MYDSNHQEISYKHMKNIIIHMKNIWKHENKQKISKHEHFHVSIGIIVILYVFLGKYPRTHIKFQ